MAYIVMAYIVMANVVMTRGLVDRPGVEMIDSSPNGDAIVTRFSCAVAWAVAQRDTTRYWTSCLDLAVADFSCQHLCLCVPVDQMLGIPSGTTPLDSIT